MTGKDGVTCVTELKLMYSANIDSTIVLNFTTLQPDLVRGRQFSVITSSVRSIWNEKLVFPHTFKRDYTFLSKWLLQIYLKVQHG